MAKKNEKINISKLARFLDVSRSSLYYKKKHKEKEFDLLLLGWKTYNAIAKKVYIVEAD